MKFCTWLHCMSLVLMLIFLGYRDLWGGNSSQKEGGYKLTKDPECWTFVLGTRNLVLIETCYLFLIGLLFV